jgi:4'-phosphopantetheinyl transferase
MTSSKKNKVDLWFSLPTMIDDEAAMRRCYPLLSAAEHAQFKRFQFKADRKVYMITRALVRIVLSKYTTLSPTALRFEKNSYGRPRVASGCFQDPIHFSISHTRELVICAVASTEEIGVDTESFNREITLELAERYFATSEVKAIKELSGKDQHRRLLEHWTLKEAYIKARSHGFHLPIDGVAFEFEDYPQFRTVLDNKMGDTLTGWQFGHLAPINHHLVAYAVRFVNNLPLHFEVMEAVPFL